jgi:hypothetical protein
LDLIVCKCISLSIYKKIKLKVEFYFKIKKPLNFLKFPRFVHSLLKTRGGEDLVFIYIFNYDIF